MSFLARIKYGIKIGARTKELYVYIIGFPLIFLLIYGSMAGSIYSTPTTISIGYMNMDQGTTIVLDSSSYSFDCGYMFYKYLDSLVYESTDTKIYSIHNISSLDEAQDKVSRLEVAVVVMIPENFSESLLSFSQSITYSILVGKINYELNEAYKNGNTTLVNIYMDMLREVANLTQGSYNLEIEIYGDPTYSKAMETYEAMWKYLINFASSFSRNYTTLYVRYLESKYGVSLNLSLNETSMDFSKTFNVNFRVIGGQGSLKESFMKRYYEVLVPGQIMQSIMLAAVSAVYLVGSDLEKGILDRIKLTKLKSSEYIGSIIVSWGAIALLQSAIILSVSALLGYIRLEGNPINFALTILTLTMAGMLSATISLIIVSFIKPKIAGTVSLIVLLIVSLYIAGYFPVSNFTIGYFMGRQFTFLDLFPWRAGITALRKTLMLANETNPADALPDITLLAIWLALYTVIAFVAFNKMRMRKAH